MDIKKKKKKLHLGMKRFGHRSHSHSENVIRSKNFHDFLECDEKELQKYINTDTPVTLCV